MKKIKKINLWLLERWDAPSYWLGFFVATIAALVARLV